MSGICHVVAITTADTLNIDTLNIDTFNIGSIVASVPFLRKYDE